MPHRSPGGRVAHPSACLLILSQSGTWVPHPCVLCKGGQRCCLYHRFHAERTASHLRRASPALYHLLLLSAIAPSPRRPQPRPLPPHSRTDPPKLQVRGRGIRRHARAHPLAYHRTRGGNSLHGHAGVEAAYRPRFTAEEKTARPTSVFSLRRRCSARPFLAGSVLRLQRLDDHEARGETAVHAT